MNKSKYEQLLLKQMRKLSAGGKAILDTGALDAQFAGEQERRRLQGLAFTNAKENANSRLALGRSNFNFEKDQLPTATALGVANVGLAGLQGYNDMQAKTEQAKRLDAIVQSLGG